ncbi:sialidase family protein [Sphingobacterium litopenaei]|uniref:exo-alpha-sialidase n=1 Tax=Sphingobacterium litopenaei TaxID=2763500 RepID=A0ABR7YFQ5_9SPHI|nr:sialidase family protein [Sphingobacterium litopenaei]MBD1430133.1 exo-alpha-sialidase [Sphingobacterium litopenaei]
MKKLFLSVCAITASFVLMAQEVTVFKSGDDGYASYRIPAIVKGKSGDLIAFSEGRVDHAGDFGNVDIVYKVSKDGGKTWGKLQIAVDYDKLQAGNPAPVVDLLDPAYPKGRVFLFYNTGNDHEGDVRKGKGLREVWYIVSNDGGQSWSQPVNITAQVHRPKQPQINPEYNFKEDWRTYANTPGHGFQFVSGPNKGRIYIAGNHNAGDPLPGNKDWNAHAYYSDDHGKTFKLSEKVPFASTNESLAAQIGENSVYMSSRNQSYTPKTRIISISHDGGQTWISSAPDTNLPDPINQASVLSWKKGKKFILAHSNAADENKRDNLTLRLSKDQGKTWYFNKVVAKSPEGYKGGAYAAYSDIVLLKKNSIGVLYEKDGYKEIVFVPVAIK